MQRQLVGILLSVAMTVPALAALKTGEMAPDFTAQASIAGKAFSYSLADALKKGPVVVYFYPSAYTEGCNVEAHTFSERRGDFDAAGATIKKETGGTGHIVTAKGDRDAAAWGKRADWCDYHAEHNGKTYGVAMFDHPENLRHPTWWMARDYGLFGANPFGWHDYENLKDQPHIGDYTIPAGGSLTLRYRFYFHLGDEKAANVDAQYAEYAAGH